LQDKDVTDYLGKWAEGEDQFNLEKKLLDKALACGVIDSTEFSELSSMHYARNRYSHFTINGDDTDIRMQRLSEDIFELP
jgi:hypothetical protein